MLHNFTNKPTHFDLAYAPVHISYRLHGSVPKKQLEYLKEQKGKQIEQLLAAQCHQEHKLSAEEFKLQMHYINRRYEQAIDDYLHNSSNGPLYLSEPAVAEEIIESWKFLHEKLAVYLYAVCVMSNHVHVVVGNANPLEPSPIDQIMHRTKSYTSNRANTILERKGQPFWDEKYYDVTIRKGRFMRAMWYVLNNPVKAGLVDFWSDWPHTFVNDDYVGLFAQVSGAGSPAA